MENTHYHKTGKEPCSSRNKLLELTRNVLGGYLLGKQKQRVGRQTRRGKCAALTLIIFVEQSVANATAQLVFHSCTITLHWHSDLRGPQTDGNFGAACQRHMALGPFQ